MGRFLTRATDLSQSPYAYCDGDPVNFADPTGHDIKINVGLGSSDTKNLGVDAAAQQALSGDSGGSDFENFGLGAAGGTGTAGGPAGPETVTISGTGTWRGGSATGTITIANGTVTKGSATATETVGRTSFSGGIGFGAGPPSYAWQLKYNAGHGSVFSVTIGEGKSPPGL